jgi:hypothetical protein
MSEDREILIVEALHQLEWPVKDLKRVSYWKKRIKAGERSATLETLYRQVREKIDEYRKQVGRKQFKLVQRPRREVTWMEGGIYLRVHAQIEVPEGSIEEGEE